MNKNWKEKRIFKLVYALYSFIENVKYQRKRCMLCNVHVLRTRSSTWRPPREPDTTTIILHPYCSPVRRSSLGHGSLLVPGEEPVSTHERSSRSLVRLV